MTYTETIEQYQKWTRSTFLRDTMIANLKPENAPIIYAAFEINGEAGELADIVKKQYIRDNDGNIAPEVAAALFKEMGDVLYGLCRLADELGFDIMEIARANVVKLESRKERGVIGGGGDER